MTKNATNCAEPVQCSEKECGGTIDREQRVELRTGCESFSTFFPCGTCGRVHDESGSPISNRPGKKVFLVEGQIVLREPDMEPAS